MPHKQILRFYLDAALSFPRYFWLGVICLPLQTIFLYALLPYFIAQAIQQLAEGHFQLTAFDLTNGFMQQLLWAAICALLGTLCNYIGFNALVGLESGVFHKLRLQTFDHLTAMSQNFYANNFVGSLTANQATFVRNYMTIQDTILLKGSGIFLPMVITLGIIFWHSLVLGLGMFLVCIAVTWYGLYASKKRQPYRVIRKDLQSKITGSIADVIANMLVVNSYASEQREARAHRHISEEQVKAYGTEMTIFVRTSSTLILIMNIFQITALAGAAWLVTAGTIELGLAIFALNYLLRLSSNLFDIGPTINNFETALTESEPIAQVLATEPEVKDTSRTKLQVTAGAITFEHMKFTHDGQDDTDGGFFEDFNLNIKPGERIGLVGHSGSGKTTLTKLLLRFADVDAGAITIDGQNIAEVTQQSLRGAIAYVPQEPLLFHRTLRENIAYAQPEATDEQVIAAATQAHAWEFIENLPHGLDTMVGERGVKLSGGQRQRVAIARAILKNAPILVLDEATSALDSQSEKLIQDALTSLMKDRTAIVIAHRLSTIQKMDRIVVLDHGRIVEQGSHRQLLAHKGIYADLWAHQSGGFIDE